MNDAADFTLFDLFRQEVREHAAILGEGLPLLGNEGADPARLEPLARAARSIRGAALIVGVEAAARLAKALEDAFVAAQQAQTPLRDAEIEALCRGVELLAALAEAGDEEVTNWVEQHKSELDGLETGYKMLRRGPALPPPPVEPPAQVEKKEAAASPAPRRVEAASPPRLDAAMLELFREEVRGHADALSHGLLELESEPTNPQRLEPLMRAAHSIKGAARIGDVEPAVNLSHALEDAFVAAQQGRVRLGARDIDVMLRSADLLASVADCDDPAGWGVGLEAELNDLVETIKGIAAGRPAAAPARMPVGPLLPPHTPPPAEIAPAPPPARLAPPAAEETPEPAEAVVRVTAQSLNRLMGLAGESLVLARWLGPFSTALLKLKKHQDHLSSLLDNLAQALSTSGAQEQAAGLTVEARRQAALCRQVLTQRMGEFEDHAAESDDLNSRLYREVLVSRMRPFADGAHGFPRLVRDQARKLGKQVRLEIDGQTTEVDRDILEKLEAPLTHLLRNAVDHGIEPPEVRVAAGKPPTGLVRVEARHRAGALVVVVSDDGGGVDLERLRRKVVQRGHAPADMAGSLGEAELLEFLFLPGFSTATEVTEFSGRGVGLDVVQDTVRKVGGSVRITSRLGQGTSFHLQLPLTLSVLRAVLVTVAGEPYAFPHNRIDRLLRVPRDTVQSLEHRQFVAVDGQNVGLVVAAQLFDLPAGPPAEGDLPVVLLSDAVGQYGLIVEALRGEQDLVVRPLDPRLGKVPNVAAGAILDDGSPVLIADVEDLIRSMDQYIQTGRLLRCVTKESGALRRKRVLVVDDSITVREVERQILATQGYDVTVAVDGQDGWNQVRAGAFDLVVSDVDMPRMTGLELVRTIRGEAALRDLPVIIVSYKDREEDRVRGLEVGANAYLTKSSFHDRTFVQAVSDLIGGP